MLHMNVLLITVCCLVVNAHIRLVKLCHMTAAVLTAAWAMPTVTHRVEHQTLKLLSDKTVLRHQQRKLLICLKDLINAKHQAVHT